ncbi:MAG: hypothetical protein Q9219_001620 [cf. Caloplaca sp. 3 TL-2023]
MTLTCALQGTTCSTNPKEYPGCCPKGTTCNEQTSAPCANNDSPDCVSATVIQPAHCCPPDIPYCFSDGCYNGPPLSSSQTTSSILPNATSKAYNGTTTLVETVSVNFLSSDSLSLDFPGTVTLATNLAGWSIATTYVFSFPSTIFDVSPSSTTTELTSTSSAPSSGFPSSSSASTKSPSLCFDPTHQSPVPCPSSGSTPAASSSSSPPYPAETTLHSSATRSTIAPKVCYVISSLLLITLLTYSDFASKMLNLGLWGLNGALGACIVLRYLWGEVEDEERCCGCDVDELELAGRKCTVMEEKKKRKMSLGGGVMKQVGEVARYTVIMPTEVGIETVREIVKDWSS